MASYLRWDWWLGLAGFLTISGVIAFSENSLLAQITPDATLGAESSVVTPNVDIGGQTADRIDGGAVRGVHLFHSFEQFNVGDGQRVYFASPVGIENIFSRVTGTDPSDILGTLGVSGNKADLFLINPNGIIFGPNATLDLNGSFVASTADSLVFDNGFEFSATNPQAPSLLTISVPIGLQFGEAPGQILVQGTQPLMGELRTLSPNRIRNVVAQQGIALVEKLIKVIDSTPTPIAVLPGKTLALVGGDVVLEGGHLTASEGRIEIGSVAGSGKVSLTPTFQGWDLGYEGVSTFGDIQLSQGTLLNTSGLGVSDIQLAGRKVTLTSETGIFAAREGLILSPLSSQNGGGISIRADELMLSDFSIVGTGTNNLGNSGDVVFETRVLTVEGSAVVETVTIGPGKGGDIRVGATDSVNLSSEGILIAGSGATGGGGNITIETARLSLQGGGEISTGTAGSGKGGKLTVHALDSVELGEYDSGLFTETLNSSLPAPAGDLTVVTRRLIVRDGALVSASTLGAGLGGNLRVIASEWVKLIGSDISETGEPVPSGLLASSGVEGFPSYQPSGKGGDLRIETGQLIVRDGAQVTVSSSQGQAGNLSVNTNSLFLNRGRITAETAKSGGEGGANIRLQVSDILQMDNESQISANAQGTANGGNINIDSQFLVALPPEGPNGSDIIAKAKQGNGGRINITTQGIFGIEFRPEQTPNNNDIDASSEFGLDGVVEINRPDIDPSQGLANLPSEPVNTEIAQDCQTGGGKATSSFISTGNGGLPTNPYEPLDSRDVLADVQLPTQWTSNSASAARTSSSLKTTPDRIVEAQGWLINEKGEVVLVAEVPSALSQGSCHLR